MTREIDIHDITGGVATAAKAISNISVSTQEAADRFELFRDTMSKVEPTFGMHEVALLRLRMLFDSHGFWCLLTLDWWGWLYTWFRAR